MSQAVGSVTHGHWIGVSVHRGPQKLSINSKQFGDLVEDGRQSPSYRPGSRPLQGGTSSLKQREEDSPARLAPSAPAAAEPEREPAASSDANPSWQPGAVDPLALFGVGGLEHAAPVAAPPAAAGFDPLISELLRSIAWGGGRRRGTARIELGSGRYGGTTLKVDVVGDSLQIDLEAPPGIDAAALGARLAERFEARGLRVDSLTWR